MDQHFPESLHTDICESLGLEVAYSTRRTKKRDPTFRHLILKRYDYQYRDAPITLPKKKDYYPRASFREGHTREVFKRDEV